MCCPPKIGRVASTFSGYRIGPYCSLITDSVIVKNQEVDDRAVALAGKLCNAEEFLGKEAVMTDTKNSTEETIR